MYLRWLFDFTPRWLKSRSSRKLESTLPSPVVVESGDDLEVEILSVQVLQHGTWHGRTSKTLATVSGLYDSKATANTLDRSWLLETIGPDLPDGSEYDVLILWRFKGLKRCGYKSIHRVVDGERRFTGSVAILFYHNRPSDHHATQLAPFESGLQAFRELRWKPPKKRRTLSLDSLRSWPKHHPSEPRREEQPAGAFPPQYIASIVPGLLGHGDWELLPPISLPGVDEAERDLLDSGRSSSKDKGVLPGTESGETGELICSSIEDPLENMRVPESVSNQGVCSDQNKLAPTLDTVQGDTLGLQPTDISQHWNDVVQSSDSATSEGIEIERHKPPQAFSFGFAPSSSHTLVTRRTMETSTATETPTTTEATSASQVSTWDANPAAYTIKPPSPAGHNPTSIPKQPPEQTDESLFPSVQRSPCSSSHSNRPFPDDYWKYDKEKENYYHIDEEEDGTKTTVWYPEEYLTPT